MVSVVQFDYCSQICYESWGGFGYLVANFELKLELIHGTKANAAECDLFLEVSYVFWRCDERQHFLAESFDICN